MILEIALGIVLGVLLLALLPILLAGTIYALRWLIPIAALVTAVVLVFNYPVKIIGTSLVITVALLLFALWVVLPGRLANSKSPTTKRLVALHSNFMGLLDNQPPFQGIRWMPIRVLVLTTAVTVTVIIATAVLLGVGMVWNYTP